jgi:hypothetical protein
MLANLLAECWRRDDQSRSVPRRLSA